MKMKRKIICILSIIFLILTSIITVNAASNASIEFKADNTQVRVGETFKVTLSAKCEDGINGVSTSYSYDENNLELVSANLADTSNWANLGAGKEITAICNSTTKITSADIYVLTFKVKDTAKQGSTVSIKLGKTLVDSDSSTNSENTIAEKQVDITILSTSGGNEGPSGGTNGGTNNGGSNGETNNGGTNNGGSNAGTNNGSTNNGGNSGNGASSNGSNKGQTAGSTQNGTNGKLPQTGVDKTILIALAIVSVLCVVSYIKYRRISH